jgi:hypothetical protein
VGEEVYSLYSKALQLDKSGKKSLKSTEVGFERYATTQALKKSTLNYQLVSSL